MIDIIIVLIIAAILSGMIYTKIKKVKRGDVGGCSCGSSCGTCPGSCQQESKQPPKLS